MRIPAARLRIEEAAKQLLRHQSLDSLTVVRLCEEAKVNRQTFYYHYSDLLDVAKQIFFDEVMDQLRANARYACWQENFLLMARYLSDNYELINNIYNTSYRPALREYLSESWGSLNAMVIEDRRRFLKLNLREEDQEFIERTYTILLYSVLSDWLFENPRVEPELLLKRFSSFFGGSLDQVLHSFARLGEDEARLEAILAERERSTPSPVP